MRTRERETVRMGANREGGTKRRGPSVFSTRMRKARVENGGFYRSWNRELDLRKSFHLQSSPRHVAQFSPDSKSATFLILRTRVSAIRHADPENGMKKYGRPFPSRKRVMPIIITGPVANRRARTIEFHVAERGDRKAGVE